jgi:hypothetical protein
MKTQIEDLTKTISKSTAQGHEFSTRDSELKSGVRALGEGNSVLQARRNRFCEPGSELQNGLGRLTQCRWLTCKTSASMENVLSWR